MKQGVCQKLGSQTMENAIVLWQKYDNRFKPIVVTYYAPSMSMIVLGTWRSIMMVLETL